MSRIYIGETPISSVMIGGKRYVARSNNSEIPAKYQRLEYVESTGTQYIDTGISGGTNAEYEIKFNPLTLFKKYETYFGGDKTPPVPKIIYENGIEMQTVIGDHSVQLKGVFPMNTAGVIKYTSDATADCNGTTFSSTRWVAGAGWGNLSVYVARSNEETNLYATMRLYYLKMWTNGELVRDFIPVKNKTTSIVGLWDTVSRTFFTDGNGGNFLGGDQV